jgi:hypothetical protein
LASSAEVRNTTSQFYGYKKNIEKSDDKYYSKENETKVWDYCMKIPEAYL